MSGRLFSVTSRLTLVQRLILGFAILIGLVSLLYSVALVKTIEYVETTLVGDIMREKITLMEAELNWGRVPFQTDEIHLYGDMDTLRPIPPEYAGVPTGYSEFVGAKSSFLFKRVTDDGHTLLLVFDQTAFEETEQDFQDIVLLSFCLVVLVSAAASFWLGRLVVNPIRRLSRKVSALMHAKTYQPMSIEFADDEVGRLARACDRTMERLFEAIERERAFTADVSHELRTPVSALQAMVENMADGVTEPTPTNLESILTQTQRLSDLIAFLLDLSRMEAGAASLNIEKFNFADFLDETIEPLEIADGGHAHDIRVTVPADITMEGDQDRLRQLFTNIIANALKHSADGTTVLVDAHEDENQGTIVTNVVNFGSQIAPSDRLDIFRRFVKGKTGPGTESGGTGLGLSIARWAAQLHGGTVKVVDDTRGADFEIILPKYHIAER